MIWETARSIKCTMLSSECKSDYVLFHNRLDMTSRKDMIRCQPSVVVCEWHETISPVIVLYFACKGTHGRSSRKCHHLCQHHVPLWLCSCKLFKPALNTHTFAWSWLSPLGLFFGLCQMSHYNRVPCVCVRLCSCVKLKFEHAVWLVGAMLFMRALTECAPALNDRLIWIVICNYDDGVMRMSCWHVARRVFIDGGA